MSGLARVTALVAVSALCGCQATQRLTRPDGDGGWTPSERRHEIETRAAASGVDLGRDAPTESADAQTRPLTLAEALALASSGNRRIEASGEQVERARQRVWNTRGLLLPSTSAAGRYTWYTDPLSNSVTVPNAPPGAVDASVTVREDEAGVLNATLTQALDVSGELRQLMAAAQAGYRGEQARRWATILDEQVDVARAYFGILAADRLTEVTQQTIAAQRRQLANAEARYSSGRTTKNDLLVVQVTLQRSEQRLLIDQLARDRARWRLNQAIGLPVDAPTAVVDVTDPPKIPDAQQALSDTWTHNPLVTARLEEQQRLEASASSLRRSRIPRFGAGAAIDWTSSDIVEPQDVGSGFVGFSWDLGTDWRREADIAAADAAVRQNKVELEADMRAIEAAVRQTSQSVAERLSAYEAARASVSQAEENLRIREQQFDVGRATSDDVLTALTLLARERATAATALYEAHTRAAQLRQLMGLSLDGSTPQGR